MNTTRHPRARLSVRAASLACLLVLPAAAAAQASTGARLTTVTGTHLPAGVLDGRSMDAVAADLDGDGDIDLVVANEFGPNIILHNDGAGRFAEMSALLPDKLLDSEDIAVADFNADGRPDLLFVSEDTRDNELYLAVEGGYEDHSENFRAGGTSNAVASGDVDGDGDIDIVIGNNGQNDLLLNDGAGVFTLATATNLPERASITQDVELADIDGDGDLDLVEANEDRNRLLINDGRGRFTDESAARLPLRPGLTREVSRDADLADIDGDGDLDLYFANVPWAQNADPRDRLLINDGAGNFTDESASRLPGTPATTTDADFADIDGDGDLDIVTTRFLPGGVSVLINNGEARFTDATALWMPTGHPGQGVDLEIADFNGDGTPDVFVCHWQTGPDQLLFGA